MNKRQRAILVGRKFKRQAPVSRPCIVEYRPLTRQEKRDLERLMAEWSKAGAILKGTP